MSLDHCWGPHLELLEAAAAAHLPVSVTFDGAGPSPLGHLRSYSAVPTVTAEQQWRQPGHLAWFDGPVPAGAVDDTTDLVEVRHRLNLADDDGVADGPGGQLCAVPDLDDDEFDEKFEQWMRTSAPLTLDNIRFLRPHASAAPASRWFIRVVPFDSWRSIVAHVTDRARPASNTENLNALLGRFESEMDRRHRSGRGPADAREVLRQVLAEMGDDDLPDELDAA